MRETYFISLLLSAALMASASVRSSAQDAAANASGSATSEASAAVEKAGKKTDVAAKSAAEAKAATEDSAEVKRGLASLKSGTAISTELDKSIDARTAKPGDVVSAKVTKDVKRDGRTVIRKGDRLLGHVASAGAGAEGKAGSELGVTFDRLARGDAEYQLNTVISSVVATSGNIGSEGGMSPLDEPMIMPGPVSSGGGGGGRGGSGGGLLGNTTSTVGSTASGAGSGAGGLAGGVGGTATSAVGSAGTAVGASEHGSAQGGAGMGLSTPLRDIRLNSHSSASQEGQTTSMLGARRGNLRLDSGTRMQFKVSNQTEAETSKK